MSKVWRLHTKPKVSVKNKLETKVANELIKRKKLLVGHLEKIFIMNLQLLEKMN